MIARKIRDNSFKVKQSNPSEQIFENWSPWATVKCKCLVEEILGEFGESIVVHQILLSKFYYPNFNNVLWHKKESKQTVIHQSFMHQKFLMGNFSKFPPPKHPCYTIILLVEMCDWPWEIGFI